MNNYSYQAAAIRHFLPVIEKEDPDGSITEQYRQALTTLEFIAERQNLMRELRKLKLSHPELVDLTEDIL